MRAQFVLSEVWAGLRRNVTMTLALIVVVAISLSLLGTGLLFVKQVDNTRTYWQGRVELSIYLCTRTSVSPQCQRSGKVSAAERARLDRQLQSMPQVTSVTFQSQSQAYQQFKQEFANSPSFVSSVQRGDIPASFQVKLKNAQTDYAAVHAAVTGQPGVDSVVDDQSILTKFYKLLDAARNAVVVVAIILLVAATLLVANTIRLSAFSRRRETGIMRLVGASNLYIQLPFLLEGVIAGVVGWAIATGLLVAVKLLLLDTLQQYFTFNVSLGTGDLVEVVVVALVVGVVLCSVTSLVTLRRYLRV